MKLKKTLSMMLIFILNFSMGILINRCNGMEITNKKINIVIPRYRCMRCGYVSSVNTKHSHNSRRTLIYCKNCINKELLGKNLKFKPCYSPSKVKRTSRFGICPNSQPGKLHLGYIKDPRINRKTGNVSRPQLVNGTDKFEFYCYDCRKDMIIPPNSKKTSGQ